MDPTNEERNESGEGAAPGENGNGGGRDRWKQGGDPRQHPAGLPSDTPVYQVRQLGQMKVSELQSIAKLEGVRHFWSTPRKQLVMEIIKQQLRRGAQIECAGVLELTPDHHGYLRSEDNHLQPQSSDPFLPVQMVRQYRLYGGLDVTGVLRAPRGGDRNLVVNQVYTVEGINAEKVTERKSFESLTALFPTERLFMEIVGLPGQDMTRRVIDIIAPFGKGQRGIIVAPPRVGKTILMKQMVQSIETNHPEVEVIVLLIDERPEEVTDFREAVKRGRVISSTFDENPQRHIQVAATAISRAKVLVENGKHVVLFLDSITRLARAYNSAAGNTGRLLSGGVDTAALQATKQFFGTARNIENGGSLTILGTALVHTGSRMDQVIFEEFKGTGNMELYLDRDVANQRIYPAVNIPLSGTRKDELLMKEEEYAIVSRIRKTLVGMIPTEAISRLIEQLRKYKTNAEFLMAVRTTLGL